MIRILLVDPDPVSRGQLHEALAGIGLSVTEASNAREVAAIELGKIDVAVSNTDLATGRGIELRDNLGTIPLILYAQVNSVRGAVEAMQQGAADYLVSPFEPTELVAAIRRCLHGVMPNHANKRASFPMARIVGRCTAMRNLLERIVVVAQTDCGALIQGEAGSGKELVARAIHAAGPRSQMPLIFLNCASIPPGLIEGELFGVDDDLAHSLAKNTRVGLIQAAQRGTLCLDEIGQLSLHDQARLVRVLQECQVDREGSHEPHALDVVLIATTHRDLLPLVEAGQFRKDLHERLRATIMSVPPLRERGEDIVELTRCLLQRICLKLSRPELALSDAAMAAIRSYEWPGNVRELENALERAVILCNSAVIEPSLLGIATRQRPQAQPRRKVDEVDEVDAETSLEGYFVKFVLEHQDSLTETELAHKLGISRKSLWERRQRLDIPRKRTRTRGSRRDVGA